MPRRGGRRGGGRPGGRPLSRQAAARIGLLEAISASAKDDSDCAGRPADGIAAVVGWWKAHQFVMDGDAGTGFGWWAVEGSQTAQLQVWAKANAHDAQTVTTATAKLLAERKVLSQREAPGGVRALFE